MREKLNYHLTLPDSGEFSGTLDGRGGVDEIQAGNRANSWDISDNGIGTVTGLNNGFTGIDTLSGGNAADTFNINSNFSGTINAGAGTNNNIFNRIAKISGLAPELDSVTGACPS